MTRVVSEQQVEVDGVPWHVRCLRRRRTSGQAPSDSAGGDGDDGPAPAPPICDPCSDEWYEAESGDDGQVGSTPAEQSEPVTAADTAVPDRSPGQGAGEPRRSERAVQPPDRYGIVVPSDFR